MTFDMRRHKLILSLWLVLLFPLQNVFAQDNAYHSVLSQGTWYKLSVSSEGVYKLDYATLQSMGLDMNTLVPDEIRIFGNPCGTLPEKNGVERPDDLTEMALYVSGAEDGVFDEGDFVLFYGQQPTSWSLNDDQYQRNSNYYTDTTYYYLCTDSGIQGMRVEEKASLSIEDVTTIVSDYPDFQYHEEELMSPYNIGRNWFGEMLSAQNSELHLDFVFPNLVTDKVLNFNSAVMGRDKSGAMHYNLRINDNLLVNNAAISKPGENYYGILASAHGQFFVNGDTVSLVLSTNPQETKASLYLDFIEIYAWRRLQRVGEGFPFRLKPSQLGHGKSAVWIQDVETRHWLWDVSSPLAPVRQTGRLSAGNFVFVINEKADKRYFMFDPDETLSVASWTPLPNQDLHSVVDADMLVITDRRLWEQAQALADFHAENDGLMSVVVDVNEIYNEFSTGIPDPTGVRDFIRMVYYRSAGNLKYVTLFGRASFDSRDLKGYGLNLVPCYEQMEDPNHEVSFCTDDYYALMDEGEGQGCSGHVDLAVGRIPVATPSEAEDVLRKIKQYVDLPANHGEWKTNHLFVSDNDKSEYVTNNEDYEAIMDTIEPALNVSKIYCGAYQRVSTSSGFRYPQVTSDLLQTIGKGLLSFTYTGHGGVSALAEERIFGIGEIASLTNEQLPFVFTATCEFSKYDNPTLLSAGEQLFIKPNSGAIAMLTTCRPTWGIHNVRIGKCLADRLYRRDGEGKPMRIGDIVRIAKANSLNFPNNATVSLNIRHVLFGDPALRLAIPQEGVKTLKINGQDANVEGLAIHAMSMVTVEGEIIDGQGQTDSQFNGELWVRLFDRVTALRVEYDKSEDGAMTVRYHKDILYRGKATVRDGRFTLSFQMPKDISLDQGAPRFSYYAYDSIRNVDAMGYFDNLKLGGIDPSMVADNEGPSVRFYWNAPSFVNGDVVEPDGTLCAELYDAQGIYHYDFSIGRNIMLGSNAPEYDNKVLNDWFEPAADDYRRGKIALPINGLSPGTYSFKLKAWDMQDNSTEASLWLVVGESNDVFLAQVYNFPNPFSEETWFTLSHCGADGELDLNIEVFDMMGRCVQRLEKRVSSTGGVIEPVRWNGLDLGGHPLSSGIYAYRLTLTDDSGFSRSVSQRVVIMR